MKKSEKWLFAIHIFNAVTAIIGSIGLIGGAVDQASWLAITDFKSYYFPGVILGGIVGGSSLFAALTQFKRTGSWQLASILAGVIMMLWIVIEIPSIRAFHVLQALYFATGAAAVWLTPRG